MQPKDRIAVAALVLSLVSLGISIATFWFNRRVKLVELKANLMRRASEYSELRGAYKFTHAKVISWATQHNDTDTLEWANSAAFTQPLKKLNFDPWETYDKASASQALKTYAERFHHLERNILRMESKHKRLLAVLEVYEGKKG